MRSIFPTILLALFLPGFVFAQYDVSGKVVAHETGQPLTGANVTVENKSFGATTDLNGEFSLSDIEKDTYTFRISFVGYRTKTRQVDVKEDRELRFTLKNKATMTSEVLVEATRAADETPATTTKISGEEIEQQNFGKDMPYLLNQAPSVVSTSDAGAGIGYTGMRIRGSDLSRTNVTINGIPLNDAESQRVFFVNIPDFASSTENIQIQRGVGTSTNGAGAFGATINIQSEQLAKEPYGELNNSVGYLPSKEHESWIGTPFGRDKGLELNHPFNTVKHTARFGTGLINDRFAVEGRLSKIASDGYIDRAKSNLGSFYLSGGYYGNQTIVKAITFGGKEKTYQAWYGVPEDSLSTNRTYNSAGRYTDANGNTRFYENETDNYQQNHYQLHASHQFSPVLSANGALHYTYGRGYFEQYRDEASLPFHSIQPVTTGSDTISKSDLIRRRWLDNDFYGFTFSADYQPLTALNLTFGGAWNNYEGAHFGNVIWARHAGKSEIRNRFYNNDAVKNDFNIYGKINHRPLDNLTIFGDLQYRKVAYEIWGRDIDERSISQKHIHHFFNPKVGAQYDINERHRAYAYFGIANREPTRSDYIDSPNGETPKPERLHNLEAGYRYKHPYFTVKANYFYMNYKDQLVKTGELNDVGTPIRTNAANSYRTGIEVQGAVNLMERLTWNANVTYSINKIRNFENVNYVYDEQFNLVTVRRETLETTDIAFSPSIVGASHLTISPLNWLDLSFNSKYIGEQYLDNTSNENRKIDDYFVNNLQLNFTFKDILFKQIGIGLKINNLFNVHYASDGYTYGSIIQGQGRVTNNFYYPQAGRNYMANLSLRF